MAHHQPSCTLSIPSWDIMGRTKLVKTTPLTVPFEKTDYGVPVLSMADVPSTLPCGPDARCCLELCKPSSTESRGPTSGDGPMMDDVLMTTNCCRTFYMCVKCFKRVETDTIRCPCCRNVFWSSITHIYTM